MFQTGTHDCVNCGAAPNKVWTLGAPLFQRLLRACTDHTCIFPELKCLFVCLYSKALNSPFVLIILRTNLHNFSQIPRGQKITVSQRSTAIFWANENCQTYKRILKMYQQFTLIQSSPGSQTHQRHETRENDPKKWSNVMRSSALGSFFRVSNQHFNTAVITT